MPSPAAALNALERISLGVIGDGRQLESWITATEAQLTNCGIDLAQADATDIQLITQRIFDNPADFDTATAIRNLGDTANSWAVVLRNLRRYFSNVTDDDEAFESMYRMRQYSHEPIRDFTRRFDRNLALLKATHLDIAADRAGNADREAHFRMLRVIFLNAIPAYVADRVRPQNPQSFAALYELAARYTHAGPVVSKGHSSSNHYNRGRSYYTDHTRGQPPRNPNPRNQQRPQDRPPQRQQPQQQQQQRGGQQQRPPPPAAPRRDAHNAAQPVQDPRRSQRNPAPPDRYTPAPRGRNQPNNQAAVSLSSPSGGKQRYYALASQPGLRGEHMSRVLVDTGADFSAISKSLAQTLNLTLRDGPAIEGKDWNGNLVSTNSYATVSIGGIDLDIEISLAVVRTPGGTDIVLGNDAMAAFDMVIYSDHVLANGSYALFDATRACHNFSSTPETFPPPFRHTLAVADLTSRRSKDKQHIDIGLPTTTDEDVHFVTRHELESELRADPSTKLDFARLELHSLSTTTTPPHPPRALALIEEFSDVFADKLTQTPPFRHEDGEDIRAGAFHIVLEEGAVLRTRRPYRMSPLERQQLRPIIDRMLRAGLITHAHGPGASPAFLVRKPPGPDGKPRWRLVIDARSLNKLTVSQNYTPQFSDDAVRELAGKKVLTSVDLVDAFYQVRATPETEELLTFTTPEGNYKLQVMAMGSKTSTATLTNIIRKCFKPLMDMGCMVTYADDIVIMSDDDEQHEQHLRLFFELCRKHKFFVHPNKTIFFADKIKFLGHIVGGDTVAPLFDRIADLTSIPSPTNISELRSFLGAVNYYRDHVKNFASIAEPLYKLTRKDAFAWNDSAERTFCELKAAVAAATTLSQPDFSTPPVFHIYTDASTRGVGAAIHQNGKPLAFYSHALSSAEANYPVRELELLAVKLVLEKYDFWFTGALIHIHTDHESLKFLSTCVVNKRLTRFLDVLQSYNLEFHYLPGPQNVVADALSRSSAFPAHAPDDARFHQYFKNILNGVSNTTPSPTTTEADTNDYDISILGSLTRTTILPHPELHDMIIDGYTKDKYLAPIYEQILSATAAPPKGGMRYSLNMFYIDNKLMFRRDASGNDRLVIPSGPATTAILHAYHDAQLHIGSNKLISVLAPKFYLRHLKSIVKRYIKSCDTCQRCTQANKPPYGLASPLETSTEPWKDISIDFLTGLPPSGPEGYDAILIVVDRFTKSVKAVPCHKTCNAEQTAWLLITNVYQHHGAWHTITSDRGPQFTAALFGYIFSRLGVECHLSTANHASSNGQAEIFCKNVINALRTSLLYVTEDWSDLLPFVNFALNSSVHNSTNMSPFFADTCREPRQFTDVVNPTTTSTPTTTTPAAATDLRTAVNTMIQDALDSARVRYAQVMDLRRTAPPAYQPGDKVLVNAAALVTPEERERQYPKLRHKREGPFTIVRRVRENAYELELPGTSRSHPVINISHLWPYYEDTEFGRTLEPPPLDADNDVFALEAVLAHRKRDDGSFEYKVKWAGYQTASTDRWLTADDFSDPAILDHYWQTHNDKPAAKRRTRRSARAKK